MPPTTTVPPTTTTAPPTTTTAPPTTTAAPPAAATAPADDNDGVPTDIENGAPNGGDGNHDGVLDSTQPNVASLPSQYDVNGDGLLNDYITVESPAGTTLANVKTLPVPADNPPPDGATLPAGLVDYDVQVANPGDNADVKLYLPDGQQSSVYMLQNNAWQKFDDHAKVDDVDNQVTLQLKDGGAGDENGTDAVIHDPVGVAPPPAATGTFVAQNETLPEPGVSFTYSVFTCGTGASPAVIGSCTQVGVASGAIADGAQASFTSLPNATATWYRVQESTQAGWALTGITCSGGAGTDNTDLANRTGAVKLSSGSANGGACTFDNAQTGTVTVVKQTNPDGDPTTFPVHLRNCGSGDNNNACSGGDPFVAPNNISIGDNGQQTWAATDITTAGGFPGRYELTEDLPAGWALSSVVCTGGTNLSLKDQLANGQRFYADSATPPIVCTFTNGPVQAPKITMHKKGDRSGGSVTNLAGATFQAYSDSGFSTPVGGATCTTDGTGTCQITNLSPNTVYYVRGPPAPSPFQRIDTMTESSGGSKIYGQAITTGANGSTVEFARLRQPPDQSALPHAVRHQHRPGDGPLELDRQRRAGPDEDLGQGLRHCARGHAVFGGRLHVRDRGPRGWQLRPRAHQRVERGRRQHRAHLDRQPH